MSRLAIMVLLPAFFEALIRNEDMTDEDDDWFSLWSRRVVAYAAGAVPFAGQAFSSKLKGYDYTFSPAEQAINLVGDTASLVFDYTFGEKEELEDKEVRKILKSLGMAFGIPGTNQLDRILSALEADDDAGFYDFLVGYREKK